MSEISQRHYLRIDTATQDALEQLCRHLFTTKSELMRRYVREGVAREAQEYAASVEQVRRSQNMLGSLRQSKAASELKKVKDQDSEPDTCQYDYALWGSQDDSIEEINFSDVVSSPSRTQLSLALIGQEEAKMRKTLIITTIQNKWLHDDVIDDTSLRSRLELDIDVGCSYRAKKQRSKVIIVTHFLEKRDHAMKDNMRNRVLVSASLSLLLANVAQAQSLGGQCFPADECMGEQSLITKNSFSTCDTTCSLQRPSKISGMNASVYEEVCRSDSGNTKRKIIIAATNIGEKNARYYVSDGIATTLECF